MGLADLHMHTIYSYDGTASVPAVLKRAKQVGLDLVAITDHDVIEGALVALDLAESIGVQVIPGIEITTAEGDLLALFIKQKVNAGLSLLETINQVGALGGICIAPHPMATGLGMKSLSAFSIRRVLRDADAARILLGIETYNATTLDRAGNGFADVLADRMGVAKTGSSDAHILETIGLGATQFPGRTADDFVAALWTGTTQPRSGKKLSSTHILGAWAANYVMSAPSRLLSLASAG